VAVIVTNGARGVMVVKAATTTIPILFTTTTDPVQFGLVASLSRPGGNITGATTLGDEVGPKRLELLHELVPAATLIAVLVNPPVPNVAAYTRDRLQTAAHTLGLRLHFLNAVTEREIEAAFATLAQLGAGALVISPTPFFNTRSEQLAALALRYAVPTIYQYRDFAAAGGLMSYGTNPADGYRLVGAYAGRILKGEKPADLPVQQATRIELIINMKTAKALGLTFPTALLVRADEVIE
jgi:putative ABC transport system substrate-binding protein